MIGSQIPLLVIFHQKPMKKDYIDCGCSSTIECRVNLWVNGLIHETCKLRIQSSEVLVLYLYCIVSFVVIRI